MPGTSSPQLMVVLVLAMLTLPATAPQALNLSEGGEGMHPATTPPQRLRCPLVAWAWYSPPPQLCLAA